MLRLFFVILSTSLILVACSRETRTITETIVQTITVKADIPIQSRPTPASLRDVNFYVVTEKNFKQFKIDFLAAGNEFVFVALSISDYENLALNMAELQRFIEQQGSLIVYYETAVK